MSNFTGVTFAQQKVLPSDDAVIRRKILSDGILYGCELSYSGSTLTMGAGQMLICGRQIRHPSAQNWAVADATSGFARLVLTVDLTRTSSKDVFEQVIDSIQYATSKDGFPELNQSDVNTTGSVYQIAACVVSLGTGGITGIVSRMAASETSGGGGLTFSLVGGLTQPADPVNNTIWVKTDYEITGYYFAPTQPSAPIPGLIWVSTGTSSPAAFNALKEEYLMVYPLSAKQYISGAWVSKEASSYLNGEWVNWWDGVLYNAGDEYVEVTGGYSGVGDYVSATNSDGRLYLHAQNGALAALITEQAINLTGFKTLKVTGYGTSTNCFAGIVSDRSVNFSSTVVMENQGTYALDISSVEGLFYVGLMGKVGNKVYADKIWLER